MSSKKSDTNQQWGGRFNEANAAIVVRFNASVDFDKKLAEYDIDGSIAHAVMLEHCSIITATEKNKIVAGLTQIRKNLSNFAWDYELEDVHMNIEAELIKNIGVVGKKLHTGRSRNDQVVTDLRLYLRDKIDIIYELLQTLSVNIIKLADKHTETYMPGFTHLQVAQPIVFAHHLLAWYEMLNRDSERLMDCRKRTNIMPLGSAALAGTTFNIDRNHTAKLLGFAEVSQNSIDAVSDRDFIIEFLNFAATTMMHLSRMSEELILWSTAQFDFITLPDRYCTGSSIMPQKKNPDMPELIRGKTGRVYGNLMNLLTIMKSQPLAYNKDNQEDKEPLFDSVKTVTESLTIYADLLPNIIVNCEKMFDAARVGYSLATDLADFLVKQQIPFRDAHRIVGETVNYAISKNLGLEQLSLAELQKFSVVFDESAMQLLSVATSVAAKNHIGGTAPTKVRQRIYQLKKRYKI